MHNYSALHCTTQKLQPYRSDAVCSWLETSSSVIGAHTQSMLLPNHTFHGQISCCIQPRTCMCHLCMTVDLLNLYIWASAEAEPQRVANLGSPSGRAHASCHCNDRRPSQRCLQPSEDCGRCHACIELDGLYWTQLRYVIMASCHQCNNSVTEPNCRMEAPQLGHVFWAMHSTCGWNGSISSMCSV